MTHTLLKRDSVNFEVGMWLRNREGFDSWMCMITVATLYDAIQLTNILNGGVTPLTELDLHNMRLAGE